MKHSSITLIINPASAGGRTRERLGCILGQFEKHFAGCYEPRITHRPGDAALFAREAVGRGCSLIVCAGGDGTIQETVNGMFASGGTLPDCSLGIVSSGTGEGFARSLGLPRTLEEQIEVLKQDRSRPVDVGRIEYSSSFGAGERVLHFVNEFQLGIGGAVVRRVNGGGHRFGGALTYGGSALVAAMRYTPHPLRMRIDGGEEIGASCIGVMIANGEFTGGGMRLAPGADTGDGLLNVLLIRAQSLPSRLRGFSRIYSGTHVALPGFSYFTAARLEIAFDGEVPQEADGQAFPPLSCAVSLLPSALRVRCAAIPGVSS